MRFRYLIESTFCHDRIFNSNVDKLDYMFNTEVDKQLLSTNKYYSIDAEVELNADNQGALKFCNSDCITARLKHIDIRDMYIKDLIEQGFISAKYKESILNKADGFTKVLENKKEFENFCTMNNIIKVDEFYSY